MQRFILVRCLQSVVTLFAAAIVVFLLGRVTGDPLDVLLPIEATAEDYERVRAHWGLDRPLWVQFFVFLGNALHGNFGESLSFPGKTALDVVLGRLPATIELAVLAIGIATVIAVPIGVIAAVRRDSWVDHLGKLVALLGQSLPSFWLAIMLIWVFSVYLGWLPTSGRGELRHMILPAIAMGWFQVAAVMRLTRSAMLEALDTEYVKLARIKGLPEWKIVWKHALRNAAIVPLTYYGVIVGALLTGSVVAETVFAWPGIGRLAVDAVRARDYTVVQTVVIVFVSIFVLSNLLVDLLYAYLDPRIRYDRT
jgi:peptide/nickel transport system permease protein